jgi:DNA-nicking Smr family endonuclease
MSRRDSTLTPTPEESLSFREAMARAGVRPTQAATEKPSPPKPKPRALHRRQAEQEILAASLRGGLDQPDLGDAESTQFRIVGIQRAVMEKLRRGLIPCQGRLDLHGLTLSDAQAALARFLKEAADSDHSCVLIIHGKGIHSGNQGPVLRPAVLEWLRERHEVLAYASPRHCEGGSGATYVLLRRGRSRSGSRRLRKEST